MDNPLEIIIKLQEENRIAVQTVSDLRAEIRYLGQIIQRLERTASNEAVKDMRETITRLTLERDDLSRITDNLKVDNEDLRKRIINHMDEINSLMEENAEYATTIGQLRADIYIMLEAKIKEDIEKVRELQTENATLTQQLVEANIIRQKIEAEQVITRKINEEYAANNKALRERIQELETLVKM